MKEPLDSIDPFDWNVFGDFLSDHDNPVGEARARRIAQTLASGRTALWLELDATPRGTRCLSLAHTPGSLGSLLHEGDYSWHASNRTTEQDVRPISPALFPRLFHSRPDVVRAFFNKLHDLGPFLWLSEDDTTVSVPASVAVCPECGGELLGTVESWTVEDATPFTVTLDCDNDLDTYRARQKSWCRSHRWRQSDWQSTHDAVEHWARDTVRVRTREAGLQSTDNPQSTEVEDGARPAHKKKPGSPAGL